MNRRQFLKLVAATVIRTLIPSRQTEVRKRMPGYVVDREDAFSPTKLSAIPTLDVVQVQGRLNAQPGDALWYWQHESEQWAKLGEVESVDGLYLWYWTGELRWSSFS